MLEHPTGIILSIKQKTATKDSTKLDLIMKWDIIEHLESKQYYILDRNLQFDKSKLYYNNNSKRKVVNSYEKKILRIQNLIARGAFLNKVSYNVKFLELGQKRTKNMIVDLMTKLLIEILFTLFIGIIM